MSIRHHQPPLPPHPRDAGPVIGSLPAFRIDMMQTFLDGWRAHGDLVRYRGPRTMCVAAHPDSVRHVLEERADDYVRTPFVVQNLRRVMGDGLFLARGDAWHVRRRLVVPAFHRDQVGGFASRMVASVGAMLQRWDDSSSPEVDIAAEMMRLDLDILGNVLFGDDPGGRRADLPRATATAMEYCIPKVMALANPPDPLHPKYRAFREAMSTLEDIVTDVIADRRREPKDDLVSVLLEARDERTGATLSERELCDEIFTTLFGSYKSLPHVLTWTWYLLSKHPSVGRRLRSELAEVLGGRPPTVHDLSRLSFTTMVVKEVLRLCPPMWALPREALADDEIGGYSIPRGITVVLTPYLTHRHPGFWDNPSSFDPERFAPDRSGGRHPYAYFPFGASPRSCVAEHYAHMELAVVTVMVAQRYRLSLVPGHPIKRRREFILRSITPMPVILEPID